MPAEIVHKLSDRIDACGPPVRLDPRASLGLAVTPHELLADATMDVVPPTTGAARA